MPLPGIHDSLAGIRDSLKHLIAEDDDCASFGYHACGSEGITDLTSLKIASYCFSIAYKVALVAAVILIACHFAVPALALGIGAVVVNSAVQTYSYKRICETAGIIINKSKTENVKAKTGECDAFPTEHSADTELWRNKLIEHAQENIVISGNYCGGKSFVKLLGLIEKQLEKKEKLKVVIISSPKFLKGNSKKKYLELTKKYPERFSLVQSPDIWHLSPGVKKATNHTKCTVIDNGKYFILGGSSIKDNFVGTGLGDLSKEQFIKSKQRDLAISIHGGSDDQSQDEDGFYLKKLIPGEFRDQDFVFSSKEGKDSVGRQVFKQAVLLAHRWEEYNRHIKQKDKFFETSLDIKDLGLFSGEECAISPDDSVVKQLLKTPVSDAPKDAALPSLFADKDLAKKVKVKILATGPEQNKSLFAKELLKKIKNAKNRIVIDQMYFQPTPEIMNALIEAAKQGVKITIFTCGEYERCPNGQRIFGPRNRYNYSYLMNALDEKQKKNVEIFEFQQVKIGLHKKVIVIDDDVIAGSSNFGYKSLVTTSDHELNFVASSKEFAEQTLKVVKVDIDHSKKVEDFDLTLGEYFRAANHRVMAPLVG